MKNTLIEFWRFVFAINMVFYHVLGHIYDIKTGGYIGVEFFAIISGYFLAASHKKSTKSTKKGGGILVYIKKRFVNLWPMYIAAYLISIGLHCIRTNLSLVEAITQIYGSFPEMFMLKVQASVNGVAWFMTAMLISGIMLWICLSIDPKQKWIPGLLLIFAIYIYSDFLHIGGHIHYTWTQSIVSLGYDGVWRVLADMAIGVLAFLLVQDSKLQSKSKASRTILCIIGNLGLATVLIVSQFKYFGFSDFWFIFIIWCAIVCLMLSEKCTLSENHKSKTICYLGGLAYPIYLLHVAVYEVINDLIPISKPAFGCIVAIVITIIEAVFLKCLLNKLMQDFYKLKCLDNSKQEEDLAL